MEISLVNKAQSSLTATAGLDRLVGMNAAPTRNRACNTATRLRLHRAGAHNPAFRTRRISQTNQLCQRSSNLQFSHLCPLAKQAHFWHLGSSIAQEPSDRQRLCQAMALADVMAVTKCSILSHCDGGYSP